MNFHIYREITHAMNKPSYQQIGSAKFKEDAEAMLARWHAGYIVDASGNMIVSKNITPIYKEQANGNP